MSVSVSVSVSVPWGSSLTSLLFYWPPSQRISLVFVCLSVRPSVPSDLYSNRVSREQHWRDQRIFRTDCARAEDNCYYCYHYYIYSCSTILHQHISYSIRAVIILRYLLEELITTHRHAQRQSLTTPRRLSEHHFRHSPLRAILLSTRNRYRLYLVTAVSLSSGLRLIRRMFRGMLPKISGYCFILKYTGCANKKTIN